MRKVLSFRAIPNSPTRSACGGLCSRLLAMAALLFSTGLRSEWNTIAIRLLYCAIYVALAARGHNAYSLDAILRR
jgi:hypothetical protein